MNAAKKLLPEEAWQDANHYIPPKCARRVKLALRNVNHQYDAIDGDITPALDNINLDVYDGELIAIVGASGCGKTTMLNIMSGMIKPSQGEVMLDGESLTKRKSKIGYISQIDTLLPWRKIISNVAMGLEVEGVSKKERYIVAKRLMETSGLAGFENKYPFELSGGMRKRAIIIRALALNPDIIFMDEPFGPLDIFTKEMLQQEILRIWHEKKNTIVYITHDIAEAMLMANRIVLMSYRPSVVKKIYEVNLPHPRDISECKFDPYFVELEKTIRHDIQDDVAKAQASELGGGLA